MRRAWPRSPPSSQAKRTRAMPLASPDQGSQLLAELKRLPPAVNGRQPVPLIETDCGLFAALPVTRKKPGRVPKPNGRKLTFAEHEACGKSVPPQLLPEIRKSIVAIDKSSVAVAPPMLVIVTCCVVLCEPITRLPKPSETGTTRSNGVATVWPRAVTGISRLPPSALLTIVSAPWTSPRLVAAKLSVTRQACCGARVAGQLWVIVNGELAEMVERVSVPLPVLRNSSG